MHNQQVPIGSGFTPSSTANDVIKGRDLTGKIAVVTGGYSGIGIETVRVLAAAGATVIAPARDLAKARLTLGGMANVTLAELDLMDPESIDRFAAGFLAEHARLDILINNAGTMPTRLIRDARGYEAMFATNHLGHFQLTARLWPALVRAGGARVVTVSSCGHAHNSIDIDDPNFEHKPFDVGLAYAQSKTANALFSLSLDAIGAPHTVRAFSLHPGGMVASGLARDYSPEQLLASGYVDAEGQPIIDPDNNMKTFEQGAATSIWCATSPQLEGVGGLYCENSDVAPAVPADSTERLGLRPWAMDRDLAHRLWALSERLTGVHFTGE